MTQKSEEAEDLRVRRTRKLLQEALLELTVEKGFAAITVRDITERAMVNRSTFYRHYLDKYDLLDKYANEVTGLTWESDWSDDKRNEVNGGAPSGLVNMLRHVGEFGDFYRVMLGQKGDPEFTERFRQNSAKRFRYVLSNQRADADLNAPPLDMRLHYLSCAGLGAILWWLENDQPSSPEQMARWLSQLSTASMGLVGRPPDGTTAV